MSSEPTDVELDRVVDEAIALRERLFAPSRSELIRCLVDNGMPREHVERQVTAGNRRTADFLEMFARKFYVDAQDARLGDSAAKARVEHCREAWGRLKKRKRRGPLKTIVGA